MSSNAITAFERLVRQFGRLIYAGVFFAILGVAASFLISPSLRGFVISGSVGGGALMTFVGVREWRRGNAMLRRMREQGPPGGTTGDGSKAS